MIDLISEKYREKCKWLIALLVVIIAVSYFLFELWTVYKPLESDVKKIVTPATSKEEDFIEISQKLDNILNETKELKNRVDAKRMSDLKIMKFGINNYELRDWELSVSGKNSLNLFEGDKVLVINNSSENKQSAHFKVKFINYDDSADAKSEMYYITSQSAIFLGIDTPERLGVFSLSVEKIN